MYQFDVKKATEECVAWIRDFFKNNGPNSPAVVGISGGKDSSVVAAICVKALGRERVYGVMMPQGEQFDINYSQELCEFLQIPHATVNIGSAVSSLVEAIGDQVSFSRQAYVNLPARIRMSALYAVSQSMDGRVANTCNLSEDWVGYSTRYGDSVGDFSPLSCFTVAEVKHIGRFLGLPEKFIEKPPIDGLSGKTDEENLGFRYEVLDRYIREGIIDDPAVKERIDTLHKKNLFKLEYMPCFRYQG